MREIEFRAWDKTAKRMYTEDNQDLPYVDYDAFSDMQRVNGALSCSFYEWLQYTGMKDKNGKKIYEGDVLRDEDGKLWVVDYFDDEACFTVYIATDDLIWKYMWQVGVDVVGVVGNIYENPELLKEEK